MNEEALIVQAMFDLLDISDAMDDLDNVLVRIALSRYVLFSIGITRFG